LGREESIGPTNTKRKAAECILTFRGDDKPSRSCTVREQILEALGHSEIARSTGASLGKQLPIFQGICPVKI